MTRGMKRFLATGVSLGAVLLVAEQAAAGGFQIRSHSAHGFGMSIAGVSAGDRLSSSFWNPAALAGVEDRAIEGVVNGVFPSFEIRPSATTNAIVGAAGGTATPSVDVGMDAVVPSTYAAVRASDRLVLGVSLTSPFGLATKSPLNWSGQVYSRTSKIVAVNINPMASYELNDRVTLGGGVMIQSFDATLSQALAVTPNAPSATLSGDDLGVGFNLGAQIQLDDATNVGLGYRSAVFHTLEGALDTPLVSFPAEVDLPTPDLISAGVRRSVTDRLSLAGTIEWTNWSRLGVIPANAAGTTTPLTILNLNYEDGWLFSVGGEYELSDRATVRAGYGYEIAPLDDATRDTRLPEVDQNMVSLGVSFLAKDDITLDLSYIHSFGAEDGPISILPGDPRYLGLPFEAESDLEVGIFSAGLAWTWR